MFESAELGHKIDKETFKKEVPKLRAALLDVQDDLLQKKEFPVVILISGVDGSGKGETINLLYSWMDPRLISTLAFSAPTDEERARPYMWRYCVLCHPRARLVFLPGPGIRSRLLIGLPATCGVLKWSSNWMTSIVLRRCWSMRGLWF